MIIGNGKVSRRSALKSLGAATAAIAVPSIAMPSIGNAQAAIDCKIILSSNSPTLAWSVSHLAEASGYFKDAGLNIERIPQNSGPASITALVAGSGHVLQSAPGEFLVAASRGQKMKTIAALSNYNAFYFLLSKEYAAKHGVTDDSPLEKRVGALKNFKGIRIGISAPGAQTDTTARVVLKLAGLNPDTDAQLIPLGSTVNSLAAMGRGAIDGFYASPPVPEFAHSQIGAVKLINIGVGDIPPLKKLASHCVLARADQVDANPELYRRLVFALTRAFRFIVENPDEAGAAVYKAGFANSVKPDLWPTVWNNNRGQFKSPYVTTESLEAWVTEGLVPGVTDPKAVHAKELVEMRFVDEAVKKLNWKVPT